MRVEILGIGMLSIIGSTFLTVGAQQPINIYDFSVLDIDGNSLPLSEYKGKVLLIVNTASRCGFTPQYKSLEELYLRYKDNGFLVLAFPANNFMNQEPGTNEEIREFCLLNYRITFPLFSKISVKGPDKHPLYVYLTQGSDFPGEVSWNFNKFLIGKDGIVVDRFDTRIDPMNQKVISSIEEQLSL